MNRKDLIMEWLLALYERFMNWRSHGRWSVIRGSEIPNIVNIKEQ